jgi:hypothetical protein
MDHPSACADGNGLARGNAHVHGLTVPIRADPRWRAAVVAVEQKLVCEVPSARRFACMAAEGVVELRRIAQARAALMCAFEDEATFDALRRLDRYESLAYAKKDKALRVIAAHRLVRDCAAALRCGPHATFRKLSSCGKLRVRKMFCPATRPTQEIADARRNICPEPVIGTEAQKSGNSVRVLDGLVAHARRDDVLATCPESAKRDEGGARASVRAEHAHVRAARLLRLGILQHATACTMAAIPRRYRKRSVAERRCRDWIDSSLTLLAITVRDAERARGRGLNCATGPPGDARITWCGVKQGRGYRCFICRR